MEETNKEETKKEEESKEEIKEENPEMDWLEKEEELIGEPMGDFERLPGPVFEENKITVLTLNMTEPFKKWTDPENGKIKAIIPCESLVEGEVKNCNWWLNLKNPIYRDVVRLGREAKDRAKVVVKVLQSGSKSTTKYLLVKE